MIRTAIQDAAISAAKGYSHSEVEPRHVLFAIARQCRAHPDAARLLLAAKRDMEPRGDFHAMPTISAAATELLESITSEDTAIEILLNALGSGAPQSPELQTRGSEARQHAAETATDLQASNPPVARVSEDTADILAELDALIGLAAVKVQVRKIIAVVRANAERTKAGLKPVNPSLHLVFTGPPGTGKTTVARIVARLYAAAGALPGSQFTEASRADLVAGYVGQTAMKTAALIERTRPGVLFIDEAYALAPSVSADFGFEAIATLVKAMEDHRDDFALVVAGYEEEMSEFVGSNPGLRSRFSNYVHFPNYTAHELTEIFARFAQENGIALASGGMEKAERIFGEAVEKQDFGNARFARSLFEQAYARMAARAADDDVVSVDELLTLMPEDLDLDINAVHRGTRRIGFARPDPRDRATDSH